MDLVGLEGRKDGVRGGKNAFNWDDVKGDRHRENYLGHSVKASVGRWQEGKDLEWFSKEKGGPAEAAQAADEERRQIRQREKRLLAEAVTRGGKVGEAVRELGAGGTEPERSRTQDAERKEGKQLRKAERDRIRHERKQRRAEREARKGAVTKRQRT